MVGVQGQVKMANTPPTSGVPPREAPPKTKKRFFYFDYKTCWIRRGFEQLSSSIAWRVIWLQSSAKKWPARDLNDQWHNQFWLQIQESPWRSRTPGNLTSISNTFSSATNLISIEIEQMSFNGEVGDAWSTNLIFNTAKGASSVWADFQRNV